MKWGEQGVVGFGAVALLPKGTAPEPTSGGAVQDRDVLGRQRVAGRVDPPPSGMRLHGEVMRRAERSPIWSASAEHMEGPISVTEEGGALTAKKLRQ